MLKTYTIDVWRDESIWTWDGWATSEEEARAAAVEQLNEDWEESYPDWDEMAEDMDGTALIEHPTVMAPRMPAAIIELYRRLADGLFDMVEEGRLSESDIPDDYKWLVYHLERIAGIDPGTPSLPPHMEKEG